ncbi:MAG: DJ-1/PfpI family protein [Sandaracinus sp.]|nr:DJ-1/PfpI family protein [Sandaracinus sp.]MCB9621195.1 DJ-1/PfpI family protein [Sandaracinus sp.]MCB9621980.1 DJ-1/PfpI family protein [Sandaracinus sp.]MCB9632851.1 DJ-1/PfpI family protein [Sandaracinus sp.]
MARVLLPLPDRDFDVTEVAVPWHVLSEAGHEVVFATEAGATPAADPLLLTGVLFGKLGAEPDAKALYARLEHDPRFVAPLRWADLRDDDFDALLLAGGHAKGMRQYLGSELVQRLAARFFVADRPVAAICHGPLVLARATHPDTGVPVLRGRKSTCLPRYLERLAWWSTAWKLGDYYRTYPAYVEEELRAALGDEGTFVRGPLVVSARGTETDDRAAFVVEDGAYVSARWPGDAWRFARTFADRLHAPLTRENVTASSPSIA